MYGKNIKDLNTKKKIKPINLNSFKLYKICSEKEFSYLKIFLPKGKHLIIDEKNFYFYINSGLINLDKKPQSQAEKKGQISENLRISEKEKNENEILIEEFIAGPEFAFEGYLKDGNLKRVVIFEKPGDYEGPYYEEKMFIAPAEIDNITKNKIHNNILKKLSGELKLCVGLCQVMSDFKNTHTS